MIRNSAPHVVLHEPSSRIHHTECFAGIRDHVVQAVELKFNCFFLMPVVDSFPTRLREELESAYDDDIDEVFDVTAVRNALESRLKALESELHQVRRTAHHVHARMLHRVQHVLGRHYNGNNIMISIASPMPGYSVCLCVSLSVCPFACQSVTHLSCFH